MDTLSVAMWGFWTLSKVMISSGDRTGSCIFLPDNVASSGNTYSLIQLMGLYCRELRSEFQDYAKTLKHVLEDLYV